ncbi:MAG: hypothetical protein E6J90_00800 [Deltaproteobacteria bacterium]|nr:MAG: hypothetical protein E6J90_00800 [Deltaproteobacteria bacterium]
MHRPWLWVLAATSIGCGSVAGKAPDGGVDSAAGDAAVNRCAPGACLLSDEFNGTRLDDKLWKTSATGGATVTQANGVLSLHLPAAANAAVDVYSLIGFSPGTTLEARVTINANQFYDHKGIGFASAAIGSSCDLGETDAVMFRGQDNDGYIEIKSGGTPTCSMTTHNYPGGTSTLQITRLADQVSFVQNTTTYGPIKANVPTGLLPVRFSAYTFTIAPTLPVQIDIDYVFVK